MIHVFRNEKNLLRGFGKKERGVISYKGFVFPEGDNVVELKGQGYVIFDAEIYNMPERHKSERGYFRKLFTEDSPQTVTRKANEWDGAWAIVYINPNGTLYAFTDPLGIKQLYFNEAGEICSRSMPIVSNFTDLDSQYRASVYKWGYNTDDRTPWNHVKRVMPNVLYSFSGGRVLHKEFYEYYRWDKDIPTEDLKDVITKAIERRVKYFAGTQTDLLLSGGLDSSIVASVAFNFGRYMNLTTLANQGELEYAELMAKYLDAPLNKQEYYMDGIDFLNAILTNEGPVDLGSVVPQYKMFDTLAGRTIFTGDGADELFGGYRRAKEYDSQRSDVFEELTFYHLPRIHKIAQARSVTVCAPFLAQDVVKKALSLQRAERIDKIALKNAFRDVIPTEILAREKKPLKNPELIENAKSYKNRVFETFYNEIIPTLQKNVIEQHHENL